MTERQPSSNHHLTFSQRNSYEPLPEPMALEQLSDDLRREIWNIIRKQLLKNRKTFSVTGRYYFPTDFGRFVEQLFGKLLKIPEDEISTSYEDVLARFKSIILKGRFDQLLSLIELIVNNDSDNLRFARKIAELFDSHAAAYWLDATRKPYQFYPRSNPEQGYAVRQALETMEESGMTGASVHLRQAAEHINTQQYADSISDSILAVESVARLIDPKAENTLGPALKSLEKAGVINHPVLKVAFLRLYGYTNNEQGIRHALLDKDSPDVGLDEAMFMFGACASFAAYLISKHRQMEQ